MGAVDSVLRSMYGPTEAGTSIFRKKNFDWVTLRYEELCDMSSVANVVRAMESEVMKCAVDIADL